VIAALNDAQILLVLDTLNQGEVEEAYAALPRLSTPSVIDFAQQMVTDHGSARQAVLSTADDLSLSPVPSETQQDLMQEGEAHVTSLRATSTAALDLTYINLEVQGHAEALELLSNLQAAADAAPLKTLITTLTATVQDHYDAAIALKSEL
jgi:putative membrane protein